MGEMGLSHNFLFQGVGIWPANDVLGLGGGSFRTQGTVSSVHFNRFNRGLTDQVVEQGL